MSPRSRARSGDDEQDQKVHQLLDIIAEEVSDVDRAANRRTYLVVKRRSDMDPKDKPGDEVVSDENGNLTAVHKADEDDDDEAGDEKKTKKKGKGEGKREDDDEADTDKQALVIPTPVKQALLRATTEALERLMSLVTAIKGAEETDEKLDKPTPDSVARELRGISQLLAASLERYPAPVAKGKDGGDAHTGVAKTGARLAGKRRDQLKNAIELLQKLLEEVLPAKSAPRGAPPGDRSTDPNRANVGAGVQPDLDAARSAQEILGDVPGLADVLKSLTSLGEVMKELKSRVRGQDEDIARLKKSTGLPASREVESTTRPKSPEPVSWPLDMNRPLSREQVAKEVSFFD